MNVNLEMALKNEMGYVEEAPKCCANCIHSEEHEYINSATERLCELNPALKFKISDGGLCNYFDRKNPNDNA